MKLLVTGKSGQVASCLAQIGKSEEKSDSPEIVFIGRPEFDLTRPEFFRQVLENEVPDVLVSVAAYTAVDTAEDEAEIAYAVNAVGAGELAKVAFELGIPIIHLSTDYVFSGTKDDAYTESDATGPSGVYGASKLQGEILVAENNPQHVILRTAWVYSSFGNNFLKTMLRLAEGRDTLSVVGDQFGNPTSAHDIARTIVSIAGQLKAEPSREENFGVFHMAGTGATNWSGFASYILECSNHLGGPHATVYSITTAEYPTKAKRPQNSRLDCSKLNSIYGVKMPDWKESAAKVVGRSV